MIRDHIGLSVSDYERSKAFSTQALAPLEIGLVTEVQGWARWMAPRMSPGLRPPPSIELRHPAHRPHGQMVWAALMEYPRHPQDRGDGALRAAASRGRP